MDVREKLSSRRRLIDANALLDEFLNQYTGRERDGNLVFAACEIKQDFADMISNVPTVDAVPVVRCWECKKHCEANGKYYCKFWRMYCPDDSDFFCKAGKRKEGAD